jgi:hypothetical protein
LNFLSFLAAGSPNLTWVFHETHQVKRNKLMLNIFLKREAQCLEFR